MLVGLHTADNKTVTFNSTTLYSSPSPLIPGIPGTTATLGKGVGLTCMKFCCCPYFLLYFAILARIKTRWKYEQSGNELHYTALCMCYMIPDTTATLGKGVGHTCLLLCMCYMSVLIKQQLFISPLL